jgi:hypothetical protein
MLTKEQTMDNSQADEDLHSAISFYDQIIENKMSTEDLGSRPELLRLDAELAGKKVELAASRTSRLWLQYMQMIDVLVCFLTA